MKKQVIGLTGGIASGKNAVAEIFLQHGFCVIDADTVSRQIIEFGTEGYELLREHFPETFKGCQEEGGADNISLDRKKLREIVFNDLKQLKKLENITHPLIREKIKTDILVSGKKHILLIVPLLFEKGFNSLCDKTITISADEKIRIERLRKRDNIGEDLIKKILSSQFTDEERELKADFVIRNNETLCKLEHEIKEFIKSLV